MNYAQYPKEYGLRVPVDHPGMKVFRAYKPINVPGWFQIVGIAIFMVLSMGWISLLADWGKPVPKILIAPIMSGLLIIVWISFLAMRFVSLQLMAHQACQDRIDFKASSEERHFGIAYCDHYWYFRNETSWDRGFLSFRNGCLCYRGFGPSFCLPIGSIRRVWITRGAGISKLPNIHVEWIHPISGPNVLRLEVRDQKSRKDCFEKSEDLVTWIQDLRSSPVESESIIWPFESTSLDFGKSPELQKPEAKDLWFAIGICAITFAIYLALDSGIRKLFHIRDTYISGIMGFVLVSLFHHITRTRVLKKLKP